MEIVTSWMEAGLEQGRLEEGRSLIIRLLRYKFGELSPSLQDRIQVLSLEQLESLGEALLGFTQVSDLERWLAQRSN